MSQNPPVTINAPVTISDDQGRAGGSAVGDRAARRSGARPAAASVGRAARRRRPVAGSGPVRSGRLRRPVVRAAGSDAAPRRGRGGWLRLVGLGSPVLDALDQADAARRAAGLPGRTMDRSWRPLSPPRRRGHRIAEPAARPTSLRSSPIADTRVRGSGADSTTVILGWLSRPARSPADTGQIGDPRRDRVPPVRVGVPTGRRAGHPGPGLAGGDAPRRTPRGRPRPHLPRSTPPRHPGRPAGAGGVRGPHRSPTRGHRATARAAVVAAGRPAGHAGRHLPRGDAQSRSAGRCSGSHLPHPTGSRRVGRSTRPTPLCGLGSDAGPDPFEIVTPPPASAAAPRDQPRRLRRPPREPLDTRYTSRAPSSRCRHGPDQPPRGRHGA